MSSDNSGTPRHTRPWSRRSVIRAAGLGLPAIAAASLVGCGDDDADSGSATPGTTPAAGASPTQVTSTSGISSAKPGDRIVLSETTYFTTTGQKAGGTFRHNSQYAGFTAEPNQAYQGDYIMNRLAYNGLYSVQWPSYATIMYLAKSIEEPDPLSWTVKLRDNVKFHNKPPVNGRALTAEDVVYSFERLRADKTSTFNNTYAFLDTVVAVDTTTLKFTSKFPYSSKFDVLPLSIVPKGAIEVLGDFNKRGIGTGPYMYDSDYDPTGVTNFVRNPDFWLKGRPFPDKVEFRHFVDQAAQVSAFRSNQIDLLGRALQKPVAESLTSSDGVISKEPFLGIPYLGIPMDKAPYTDIRVRQAISLAIDRKELVSKLDFGDGAACGPCGWGLGVWALPQKEIDDFYKVESYEANLAEAKKILEAVGVSSLPAMEIIAPSDLPIFASGAPLIANMMRKAGFNVKENLKPLTTVVREHLITRNFDLIFMQTGTQEDPWAHLSPHGTRGTVTGASGRYAASTPAVDAALNGMQAATKFEDRVAKAHEAQRLILKTYGAQMHLWEANAYFVAKKGLKDYRVSGALSAYDQYDFWLSA
ncbi:MAG: ABC transporter substrate-binding protein [Dehalococcoidia bacterium]